MGHPVDVGGASMVTNLLVAKFRPGLAFDRPAGISWAEVSVALARVYGAWLPARCQGAEGQTFLHQLRTSAEASAMQTTLGEQARTASILVMQYRWLVDKEVLPDAGGGKVRSLLAFGFSETIRGLRHRPSYPAQSEVCDIMLAYVRRWPQ